MIQRNTIQIQNSRYNAHLYLCTRIHKFHAYHIAMCCIYFAIKLHVNIRNCLRRLPFLSNNIVSCIRIINRSIQKLVLSLPRLLQISTHFYIALYWFMRGSTSLQFIFIMCLFLNFMYNAQLNIVGPWKNIDSILLFF